METKTRFGIKYVFVNVLMIFCANLFAQTDTLGPEACIKEPDVYMGQAVYRIAEKMPEYKGGMDQFYRYISKELKCYCKTEYEHKSSIYTTFIVDTLGRIREVCTISRTRPYTPDELQVKDLISKSPPWTPGIINNKAVVVRMTVPIKICLR